MPRKHSTDPVRSCTFHFGMTAYEHHQSNEVGHDRRSWRVAIQATLHCLTGCAIGEILGMVIAAALGLSNALPILISVVLAFTFGYALTLGPVLGAGVPMRRALRLTVASDTVSITTME